MKALRDLYHSILLTYNYPGSKTGLLRAMEEGGIDSWNGCDRQALHRMSNDELSEKALKTKRLMGCVLVALGAVCLYFAFQAKVHHWLGL